MYATENDNRLVPARMSTEGWIDTPQSATGQKHTATQTNPPVLDADEIRGIKKGLLFQYTEDPDVYHCPADNIRISKHDQTRVFTSYSIPACLMGWTNNTPQIKILTAIKSPSTKFNFVESAETRNFNMNGRFVMGAPEYGSSQWQWWGPMAINHNKASILGFTDGHSEKHKWRDQFTIDRVDKLLTKNVDLYGKESAPADQQEDIRYMARGWAYEKK